MARRTWIATAALLIALAAGGFVATRGRRAPVARSDAGDFMALTDGEGHVMCVSGASRIQVRGRLLEASSGTAIEGATLWIYSTREDALGDTDRPPGIEPDAVSGADGRFDLRVSRIWYTSGEPFRLRPFWRAEALAIEKEGWPRQVVDCTRGMWTEHEVHEFGDIHGTADLGDVRVSR